MPRNWAITDWRCQHPKPLEGWTNAICYQNRMLLFLSCGLSIKWWNASKLLLISLGRQPNKHKKSVHQPFYSYLDNVRFCHLRYFANLSRPHGSFWSSHWEVKTVPDFRRWKGCLPTRGLDLFNREAIRDWHNNQEDHWCSWCCSSWRDDYGEQSSFRRQSRPTRLSTWNVAL